jgi:hypothetical protein
MKTTNYESDSKTLEPILDTGDARIKIPDVRVEIADVVLQRGELVAHFGKAIRHHPGELVDGDPFWLLVLHAFIVLGSAALANRCSPPGAVRRQGEVVDRGAPRGVLLLQAN